MIRFFLVALCLIAAPAHAFLTPSSGAGSGTVTSVGLVPPVGYSVSGSPVTGSGSITMTLKASQAVAALAIDWSAGNIFTKTLSANSTFTFSNVAEGQTIVVAVTNTASNYTVTWPTVSWSGGTPPVQTVGVKTDIYTFIRIGSVTYGSAIQNF